MRSAPQRTLSLGHHLYERDELQRKAPRLSPGPGLSPPEDLEEVSMPAQQRLGADHVQGVSPSAGQSGQGEEEHAVVAVEPRPLDAATQYDELLTQRQILGDQVGPVGE